MCSEDTGFGRAQSARGKNILVNWPPFAGAVKWPLCDESSCGTYNAPLLCNTRPPFKQGRYLRFGDASVPRLLEESNDLRIRVLRHIMFQLP